MKLISKKSMVEVINSMKKYLLCIILIISFSSILMPVLSVEITICSSGTTDWNCEIGQTCSCRISGLCTNGNLLLYRGNLTGAICSPQIIGGSASINWDYCNFTSGSSYAMADCDEGQSTQKSIMFSQGTTTTITTTTAPVPTTSITVPSTSTTSVTNQETHKCFSEKGYCEDVLTSCQEGYEYCPEHNEECGSYDEVCCCSKQETGGIIPTWNGQFKIVVFIVLAVVVGFILFLFFINQTKRGMSFEKLYKKWSK